MYNILGNSRLFWKNLIFLVGNMPSVCQNTWVATLNLGTYYVSELYFVSYVIVSKGWILLNHWMMEAMTHKWKAVLSISFPSTEKDTFIHNFLQFQPNPESIYVELARYVQFGFHATSIRTRSMSWIKTL